MKKIIALTALAGCFGMIGCWEYELAPKCEDDIIVGARMDLSAETTSTNPEFQVN